MNSNNDQISFTIPSSYNSSTHSSQLYTFAEFLKYDQMWNVTLSTIDNLSIPEDFGPVFSTYMHPMWKNWNAVWKQEPFILKYNIQSLPQLEFEFPDAGYRFYLQSNQMKTLLGGPIIAQGTTVVFDGFETLFARYVIEWCEKKDHEYAYLRTVGYTDGGIPIPHDNHNFPTFILAVPVFLSTVPFRPPITSNPIDLVENLVTESTWSSFEGGSSGRISKIARKVMKSICKLFKK
jgi:hypothetical protein